MSKSCFLSFFLFFLDRFLGLQRVFLFSLINSHLRTSNMYVCIDTKSKTTLKQQRRETCRQLGRQAELVDDCLGGWRLCLSFARVSWWSPWPGPTGRPLRRECGCTRSQTTLILNKNVGFKLVYSRKILSPSWQGQYPTIRLQANCQFSSINLSFFKSVTMYRTFFNCLLLTVFAYQNRRTNKAMGKNWFALKVIWTNKIERNTPNFVCPSVCHLFYMLSLFKCFA